MQQGAGYWTERRRVLYTRRSLMRGTAFAAGSLAATALACGSRKPAGSSQGPGGVSVGRSATQSAGETPQMGGTVTWFDGANPPTLDPQATSSVTTMQAVAFRSAGCCASRASRMSRPRTTSTPSRTWRRASRLRTVLRGRSSSVQTPSFTTFRP